MDDAINIKSKAGHASGATVRHYGHTNTLDTLVMAIPWRWKLQSQQSGLPNTLALDASSQIIILT